MNLHVMLIMKEEMLGACIYYYYYNSVLSINILSNITASHCIPTLFCESKQDVLEQRSIHIYKYCLQLEISMRN